MAGLGGPWQGTYKIITDSFSLFPHSLEEMPSKMTFEGSKYFAWAYISTGGEQCLNMIPAAFPP